MEEIFPAPQRHSDINFFNILAHTMAYLDLQHIHKRYGTVPALRDISLTFAEGQFTCILGPSGCGKTTLLHILAGIVPPTEGSILLQGNDISSLPPEYRNMGMVFQHYALFPNLTVEENIGYGLYSKPLSAAQKKARTGELLELIELTSLARQYPASLSGGQQQRVALARALAPSPAVLLLDEPLSALDAKVRENLGQELLRIQRQTGVTAIMVTHDQTEALALAERIVVMNKGVVEQDGSPDDLYERPDSLFVAEFIGHMNIISMPSLAEGTTVGLRYEEVHIAEPSEQVLATPHTFVGKIEHRALMGSFFRFELLLNDFQTRLFADMPRHLYTPGLTEKALVAVSLPQHLWRTWNKSA